MQAKKTTIFLENKRAPELTVSVGGDPCVYKVIHKFGVG